MRHIARRATKARVGIRDLRLTLLAPKAVAIRLTRHSEQHSRVVVERSQTSKPVLLVPVVDARDSRDLNTSGRKLLVGLILDGLLQLALLSMPPQAPRVSTSAAAARR